MKLAPGFKAFIAVGIFTLHQAMVAIQGPKTMIALLEVHSQCLTGKMW
jgi:hypothetical protein